MQKTLNSNPLFIETDSGEVFTNPLLASLYVISDVSESALEGVPEKSCSREKMGFGYIPLFTRVFPRSLTLQSILSAITLQGEVNFQSLTNDNS
jgi:hypothetical protein